MKTILFFLTFIISVNGNSQVNLVLTGNCSLQGVYATTWSDETFWNGSGGAQTWNTPNLLDPANSVTGDLVIVDGSDPIGVGNCTFDMACSGITGFYNVVDIVGKIAVVKRGSCQFGSKALAVQQAGAIACIIIDAVDSLTSITGGVDGSSVTIPTIMVSHSAGIAICDAINQGCSQAYIGDPLYMAGFNSITGSVLYDVNNDNCATSTLNITNLYPIVTTDGINTISSFSVSNQNYLNYVSMNTYNTSILNLPYYLDAMPNQDVVTFSTVGNAHIANFCIVPNQSFSDVNVELIPFNSSPGHNTTVLLVFQNSGNQTASGTISLEFNDSKLNFISASDSTLSQINNKLIFNYSNLLPFETRSISITFFLPPPPYNYPGDSLSFNAHITTDLNDMNPLNNYFVVNDLIIGPYDPNDIRVVEGDEVYINNAGEYLHYKVRFQNTGTAPAVNVVVNQTLDVKLDWSTLQIVGNSHPLSVSMFDDSVNFKFYGINLPDSNSNEPASHGYLIYKIKPLSSVVVGDVISATANIYFDFNSPVITNTAITTFTDFSSVTEMNNDIKIYPNPTTNIVHISSSKLIQSIQVYNQLGELVFTENNPSQINLSNFGKGVYFLRVTNIDGQISNQKVIKK